MKKSSQIESFRRELFDILSLIARRACVKILHNTVVIQKSLISTHLAHSNWSKNHIFFTKKKLIFHKKTVFPSYCCSWNIKKIVKWNVSGSLFYCHAIQISWVWDVLRCEKKIFRTFVGKYHVNFLKWKGETKMFIIYNR